MRQRKLASIQRVLQIEAIPGADMIEKITILWWHLVAKKWEFKVWDLCVYFEIDSLLPVIPLFDFLSKWNTPKKTLLDNWETVEGYRLKTIKLRWVISQWLALQTNLFKELDGINLEEWMDVTELLGIYKYEPPIPPELTGVMKWVFPAFLPKTDEPRIQSHIDLLDKHRGKKFFVTEKLNWTSYTIYVNNWEVWVCWRNIEFCEWDITQWKVAKNVWLVEKLQKLNKNISLQWELVWEWIQWNDLSIKWHSVRFFNAIDIDTGKYFNYEDFINITNELEIPTVPVIDIITLNFNDIDEIVEYATRKSVINPKVWAEWVVFRPLIEENDDNIWRLSFKCINPQFLLNGWD